MVKIPYKGPISGFYGVLVKGTRLHIYSFDHGSDEGLRSKCSQGAYPEKPGQHTKAIQCLNRRNGPLEVPKGVHSGQAPWPRLLIPPKSSESEKGP